MESSYNHFCKILSKKNCLSAILFKLWYFLGIW